MCSCNKKIPSQNQSKKVAVLGSGSWGTVLASHLARAGYHATLWGRDGVALAAMERARENHRYLPGLQLPDNLLFETDLKSAVRDKSLLVVAVPSSAVRKISNDIKDTTSTNTLVVNTAKGLEVGSLKFMHSVLAQELGNPERIAVLSGPSFAKEVFQGYPTAVTVASISETTSEGVSNFFHHGNLRTYTSKDVIGVEVGGVVKNVIAIAVGIVDGMNMGANSRAALITRGLVEIERLALSLGASPMTVTGLSGLGDLILTATGDLSRNRQVGLGLGRGENLEDVTKRLGQVVEGVVNASAILALSQDMCVSMPIVEEVNKVLNGESLVEQSVKKLLNREKRSEFTN